MIRLLWLAALALAPAGDDRAALEAKVDALVQPLLDAGLLPGLALGVRCDGEQLVKGYGRFGPDDARVPDGRTVYEIGSISKVFTSLLLADAVERGLAEFDTPVADLLPPEVEVPEFEGQPIRLWHLATHTSGLPRMPVNFAPKDPRNPYADYGAEALQGGLFDILITRAPGAQYDYSNLGAGLLGHALVLRTGSGSYDALLQERIAVPLGLMDTGVVLSDEGKRRLAPPFDADQEPNWSWDLDALAGAGAIRSTVEDLLRFAAVELEPAETPLSAAIAASQEQRHSFGAGRGGMALGWHVQGDGRTLWHNGQTGGYHGFLSIQLDDGVAVAILTNCADGTIDELGRRIGQLALGAEVPPLPLPAYVAVAETALERLVGRYDLGPLIGFDVTRKGARLYVQLTGQPRIRLWPLSETRFAIRVVDASIDFELDGDRAVALVLHQDGKDQKARKR